MRFLSVLSTESASAPPTDRSPRRPRTSKSCSPTRRLLDAPSSHLTSTCSWSAYQTVPRRRMPCRVCSTRSPREGTYDAVNLPLPFVARRFCVVDARFCPQTCSPLYVHGGCTVGSAPKSGKIRSGGSAALLRGFLPEIPLGELRGESPSNGSPARPLLARTGGRGADGQPPATGHLRALSISPPSDLRPHVLAASAGEPAADARRYEPQPEINFTPVTGWSSAKFVACGL
jgi:hypothetical protein